MQGLRRRYKKFEGDKRLIFSIFIYLLVSLFTFISSPIKSQTLTLVELNCENLFDYRHDEGKDDTEYLPEATRHWTKKRYWRKLNHIAQELLSCSEEGIPDLIVLCEVENDSVMRDLTRRSLLRNAGYDYIMTSSPDLRGIDVALLYSPFLFSPVRSYPIRVTPIEGMRPTRDILYVCGETRDGDTLHVFAVHAPSRYGGERHSRPFRQTVIDRLCQSLDSIQALLPEAQIVIAGDFNDGTDSPVFENLKQRRICQLTNEEWGNNGIKGTYRYQGKWERIDQILCSRSLWQKTDTAYIHAPLFLLEEDKTYGGYKPRRTYNGMRYQPGYSDHLPLVARFRTDK